MNICGVPCRIEKRNSDYFSSSVILPYSVEFVKKSDIECTFAVNDVPVEAPFEIAPLSLPLKAGSTNTKDLIVRDKINEYQGLSCSVFIFRRDKIKSADLEIAVKTTEEETLIPLDASGLVINTKSDTANLSIKTGPEVKIVSAKIAGEAVNVVNGSIEAKEIGVSDRIEIELEFFKHEPISLWFALKKVDNIEPPELPKEVQVSSIRLALIDKNNKQGEFKDLEGFKPDGKGPYNASEYAETAYITLKVEIKKPNVENFVVYAKNTNTYSNAIVLERGSGVDSNFFVTESNLPLAKGKNSIDIVVRSSNSQKQGKYRLVVNYEGGPDFSDPNGASPKKLIPGIYCPAIRKASADNPQDRGEPYVWLGCIAGRCGYCSLLLKGAGTKGEDLAQKFKDKGLRVVMLEDEETGLSDLNLALKKWKDSGRGYNMYTSKNNCLYPLCKNGNGGIPRACYIKDGQKVGENTGAQREYASIIKKYFGLE